MHPLKFSLVVSVPCSAVSVGGVVVNQIFADPSGRREAYRARYFKSNMYTFFTTLNNFCMECDPPKILFSANPEPSLMYMKV